MVGGVVAMLLMLINALQLLNTVGPMFVTPEPKTTDCRDEQLLNAPLLIVVTESGIITLVNPLQ